MEPKFAGVGGEPVRIVMRVSGAGGRPAEFRLREQIDLFGAVGATANERYELEKGALAGLSPALKEQLTVQLDILDGLNAEKDAQEKLNEIMKERESAINRDIENGAALIEAMQFELSLLGMTNEQREREILAPAATKSTSPWPVAPAGKSNRGAAGPRS